MAGTSENNNIAHVIASTQYPNINPPLYHKCACVDFAGLGSWLNRCWSQRKMVHMRSISLLVVLWAHYLHAQVSPEWKLFEDFTERYNKPYQNDSDIKNTRFLVFKVHYVIQVWYSVTVGMCSLSGESSTPTVADQVRGSAWWPSNIWS